MIGARNVKRLIDRMYAITDSLNVIVEEFLKSKASHLWIVDSDVEVPEHALQKLLDLDVDVASGVYPMHGDVEDFCAGRLGPSPGHRIMYTTEDYLKNKILLSRDGFVAAGNGCLLIKRRVFEEGKFDDFDAVEYAGKPLRFRTRKADIQFFADAQEMSFSAAIHGGVICGHLPQWPLADYLKERPKTPISIVVPHFNKQRQFEKVWEALRPQMLIGDQLILVDNYTKDLDLKGKYLRLVRPDNPSSEWRLNTLRNLGIYDAQNDAILIIDADCVPASDLLAQARAVFDPAVLFGGRIDFFNPAGMLEPDPRLKWSFIKGESRFVDDSPSGSLAIWGGVMLFSKLKTCWLKWFDKEYNGNWGLGENDFAQKCCDAGIRLRYEQRLKVKHLYHKPMRRGYSENKELFNRKSQQYMTRLNEVTNYRPEVMVLVCTFMRHWFLENCLMGLIRNYTPIKIKLVNQGDTSPEMHKVLMHWANRWAVEYKFNPEIVSMAKTRAEVFQEAHDRGFKYVVTVDDDMTLQTGALDRLVLDIKDFPQFHAISGFCIDWKGKRLLGGKLRMEGKYGVHERIQYQRGVHPADFISSGFRIVKLEPLVLQDVDYDFGWIDFDYANRLKAAGLKLAVSGNAGGWHKCEKTKKGWQPIPTYKEPQAYLDIRLNRENIQRHKQLFISKWGYEPVEARFKKR